MERNGFGCGAKHLQQVVVHFGSCVVRAQSGRQRVSVFEMQSSRLKAFMLVTTINLKLKVNFHHWT